MAAGRCQDIEAVFRLYQEQVVCPIVFLVFVTNHTHFYLLFPIRDPLLISCFICDFLAPNCLPLCGLLTSPVPLHCSLYSSSRQPFGPRGPPVGNCCHTGQWNYLFYGMEINCFKYKDKCNCLFMNIIHLYHYHFKITDRVVKLASSKII